MGVERGSPSHKGLVEKIDQYIFAHQKLFDRIWALIAAFSIVGILYISKQLGPADIQKLWTPSTPFSKGTHEQ